MIILTLRVSRVRLPRAPRPTAPEADHATGADGDGPSRERMKFPWPLPCLATLAANLDADKNERLLRAKRYKDGLDPIIYSKIDIHGCGFSKAEYRFTMKYMDGDRKRLLTAGSRFLVPAGTPRAIT
jgi:hypothetical protein